ncbi:hypothetical protein H632_c1677p0, partial [Helicosporidium sp. ATCC 50920]
AQAKAASAPAAAPFRLPIRDDRVNDLLLWKDVKKSGIALAAIVGASLSVYLCKISLLSAALYTLLAAVVGVFVWNNFASFTNRPTVPVPSCIRNGVSEECAKAGVEKALPHVNCALGKVNRLLSGREPLLTAAAAAVLYVSASLTAHVSLSLLALFAGLAAFSLPKVYELKHVEVDAALCKARDTAVALYDQHLARFVAMLPRGAGAAKKEQ